MQLIITASTVEELMEKVCALANRFGVDLSENTKTPVTTEVVEAAKTIEVEAEVVEEPKKKKQGKKEKETTVVVEENTEFATFTKQEEVVETAKTYTKQDIADACQKVSEAKGLEFARKILAKFDAKRISEVKTEDYGAFIAECESSI